MTLRPCGFMLLSMLVSVSTSAGRRWHLRLLGGITLLTNESLASGHFVSFRLVAINSARDAIGTRVKLTAGGQVTTLQLTAGDGFHASNERRMTCGIGENSRVTKVEVDWPSGHRQEFLDLAADQEWMLLEQHPAVSLSFLPVSD